MPGAFGVAGGELNHMIMLILTNCSVCTTLLLRLFINLDCLGMQLSAPNRSRSEASWGLSRLQRVIGALVAPDGLYQCSCHLPGD